MSSVAGRMSQSLAFQFFRKNLGRLFSSRYLLLTNTALSISMSGTGDILQQKYENLRGRHDDWDATRTRNQCISGAVIGPSCHFWYLWLDRVLPGRTARVILRKVLLDQVIMSPICVAQFLTVTSLLEGKDRKELITEFRTKGATLLVTDWLIWPPAQLINFFLVPTRFRILYDNTVSLAFDYYYSYVKYRKDYSDHACFKEAAEVTPVNVEKVSMVQMPRLCLPNNICCDIHTMSSSLDRRDSSIDVEGSIGSGLTYIERVDRDEDTVLYCQGK